MTEETGVLARALDRVYAIGGVLALFFLGLTAFIVALQIGGRTMRMLVPGAPELAGFSAAATFFLALPDTLRGGGHIRVNLVLSRLTGRIRFAVEVWCLLIATVAVGYFAYSVILMTLQSYQLGDVSTGILGVPLWIPQLGMLIGVCLLEVAFLEETVRLFSGKTLHYDRPTSNDFTE